MMMTINPIVVYHIKRQLFISFSVNYYKYSLLHIPSENGHLLSLCRGKVSVDVRRDFDHILMLNRSLFLCCFDLLCFSHGNGKF